MSLIEKIECLVFGMGLYGCAAAWELAEAGKPVYILNKDSNPRQSSSELLAGGLNSVSEKSKKLYGDSVETHIAETLKEGRNLNSPSVVRDFIEHFDRDVIQWTEGLGVKYDDDLHAEGSNIHRVNHISDHTGKDVMEVLHEKVRNHPNITVLDDHMAFDLITENWLKGTREEFDICRGAYVYDIKNKVVKTIQAENVFVGTGGVGALWPATSNPQTATGDGIAMAYRAYLPIVLMEMLQFHPTGLATPGYGTKPLCTQGLRGAGAYLKLEKNKGGDFIREKGFDAKRGSDTGRAIASLAIAKMCEELSRYPPIVWLDCLPIPSQDLIKGYSTFYKNCIDNGMDPTKEPVPVVPLLHYCNGGVLVGKYGETLYDGGRGIARLNFGGENACPGIDGADRFPSNSGPSAVLLGRRSAWYYLERDHPQTKEKIRAWDTRGAKDYMDQGLVQHHIRQIQSVMGSLCGIIRSASKLAEGKEELAFHRNRIKGFYDDYLVDERSLTARNMIDVGFIIMESANYRTSSIGGHFRIEYPEHNPNHNKWTVVQKYRAPYFIPIPK